MNVAIRAIDYHLPSHSVSNEDLAREFPDWSIDKIRGKTGISTRHIAADGECASDLAVLAAAKLFSDGLVTPAEIDYLLLCTQSPDYFLPTTACLLQDRLGLPTTCGALDFNLGCSGFVYGLGMAHGLVQTGQATNVLLITAETYSKFINPGDRSVRTLFGDAAAATLISAVPNEETTLRCMFVYGTDGKGAPNLIVQTGGLREPKSQASGKIACDDSGNSRSRDDLYMNGAEIFNFTLRAIPECVSRTLARAALSIDEIDLFVFHQANQYMLEHLRKKLKISSEKFYISFEHCGNTVSSTIPIALRHAVCDGRLHAGDRVMLVGFGVGYSWGATLLQWPYLGVPAPTLS